MNEAPGVKIESFGFSHWAIVMWLLSLDCCEADCQTIENPESEVRNGWQVIRESKIIKFELESSPLSCDKTLILWNKRRPSGWSEWMRISRASERVANWNYQPPRSPLKQRRRMTFGGQKGRIYMCVWSVSAVRAQRGWRSCLLERIRVLWEVGWTVCLCGDVNPPSCSPS